MEDKAILETKHRGLLLVAVMGVSIIQILDMTIANVALPHIQSSLGASIDTITWVLTSYIIAGVMMMPAAGWLSDRFGSRRLFILSAAGFIIASMLCGAATSLPQMVAFRTLQGISSAFILPMSQTIVFDISPPSKQPAAMSLWGLVIMIAPISGPVIGGLLTDYISWRWVFYINLPIGIPALILLIWLLPSRPIVERKLDKSGFFLLAISLGALQLMLDRGQHKDWFSSWEIIIELGIALGFFWMFVVHTLWTRNPLFPRALIKNYNFLGACGFMVILGIANIALSAVLPTMYQTVYNYGPVDTGMLLVPRGFGVVLTMLIATRLTGKVDSRYIVTSGYLIAGLAMWTMYHWSLDMDYWPIVISGFIQGLGLGFVFMPMNIIAFATLDTRYRPDGSSMLALTRNLGSSFGISAIVTLLARNTQTSHSDIAGNITPFSTPVVDLSSTTERLGEFGSALLQMVDGEVTRQALMIAYLDIFYAMTWFILFCAPLALLLKPIKQIRGERPVHVE